MAAVMRAPLLVLGTGPAGLAAAEAASAKGALVTLVDENPQPGGQIWRGGPHQWRDARAHALWQALRQRPNVRVIAGARVVAAPAQRELLLDTGSGAQAIAWERLVLCSGARELLLPFPGWTVPGVFGAGGMQALIKGGMPVAGKRVVVAGSGPLLLAVADTVRRAGGSVLAIAEQRSTSELAAFMSRLALSFPGKLRQALGLMVDLRAIPYRHAATVVGACGGDALESVIIEQGGKRSEVACDFLACGFGLVPNLELATLVGCNVREGRVLVDLSQRTSRPDVWAAGESTGIGGGDKALAEGRIAGLAAADCPASSRERIARDHALRFGALLARSFAPTAVARTLCQPDTVVCRCEDVTAARLAQHADWRSAKLLTRAGMGPCQGRVCGAACQVLYGWDAPGLQQPVFPTTAQVLAGGLALSEPQAVTTDCQVG